MALSTSKLLENNNSDLAHMIAYLNDPPNNKRNITEDQMVRLEQMSVCDDFIREYHVRSTVCKKLIAHQAQKGRKLSRGAAYNLFALTKLVNLTVSYVGKEAAKPYYLAMCDEMLMEAKKKKNFSGFSSVMKLIIELQGYNKDELERIDPADLETPVILFSNDSNILNIPPMPEEEVQKLVRELTSPKSKVGQKALKKAMKSAKDIPYDEVSS